jgi:hypothetical protein
MNSAAEEMTSAGDGRRLVRERSFTVTSTGWVPATEDETDTPVTRREPDTGS